MPCHRCHNLMFPVDLLDEAGGILHQPDAAWRCFACGNIIDPLICLNRVRPHEADEALRGRGPRQRVAIAGPVAELFGTVVKTPGGHVVTCEQCRGWMVEEQQDSSPEMFIWRCIHCGSIQDPSRGGYQKDRFGDRYW